jgi:hypothetical protein
MARGKNSLTSGIRCGPYFFFILPDQRLYIVKNVRIYTYIHTYIHIIHVSDCVQTVNELLFLPSSTVIETFLHKTERCEDSRIYHWDAGLRVTGRIHDIGQNVLEFSL